MSDYTANDSLLDMFIFETSKLMEQLEQIILSSEDKSSFHEAEINEIFRIMHTIKGSAALMMFHNISKLAHSMEDLFYYIREEKPSSVDYSAISDLVLEGIDFLKVEIEKISIGENSSGDETKLIQAQKEFLNSIKQSNSEKKSIETVDQVEYTAIDLDVEVYEASDLYHEYKAVIFFDDGCEMENIRAFGVIHNLKKVAHNLRYQPEDLIENKDNAELINASGFTVFLKSELTFIQLQDLLQQTIFLKSLELVQLDVVKEATEISKADTVKTDTSAVNKDIKEIEVPQAEKSNSTIREVQPTAAHQSFISVSVTKLDMLLDLVGEMVVTEAMVINNPDLKGLELNNFQKAARQLSKISNEMKDMVMSIRMVPLSATLQKMNRIVRDMNKKLNKEVQLEIIGEETEVDKNIIEHISDPLMHLIRNSADHGIETVEERRAAGKAQNGTITIEAKNAGSDVLIIIRDDGRGLDKKKILEKARENNLLVVKEELMTEKDIFRLILLPGFSTKDKVTEFSGRGVGMDVVSKNIEAVSGSISIDSVPGKGTTVTIKIPLTLAIIDAMNIKVGNSYFSLPTIFIKESFRLKENNLITDPDGNEMIMIRGQCYPLIRLHKLYGIETKISELSEGIIIMLQQEGKAVCIFADALVGQQQIVAKSLPRYLIKFKKIKGLSGCTLLGDGSISLILDVTVLVN